MRWLKRIPVLAAWSVVATAFLLLVLEESGVLVSLVRTRLAHHLGPLGEGLTIERVGLRWFEPGIVIEDLRLRVPNPARTGTANRAETSGDENVPQTELFHLAEAGVSFGFEAARPLRRVHVSGGRIRISDRLFEVVDAVVAAMATGSEGPETTLTPPPFAIRDFHADLELPDGTLLQLGRATLVANLDERGRYHLRGRVLPLLSGLVSSPRPIYVDGRQNAAGLSLRTAAQGLPFQSRSFARPPGLERLGVEEFSGELTLDATANVDWGGEHLEIDGELRARLDEGRILPRAGDPLLEDVRCDVDVAVDLAGGRRLWDRELWDARARLSGSWLGSGLEAHAAFGRDLPDDTWAHAWARFDGLPLERELLELLRARPNEVQLWDSLEPQGAVALQLDLRVPPPELEGDRPRFPAPSLAVAAELDGRARMRYVGIEDPSGEPLGFPIPVDDVRGEVLVVADGTRERFSRVWFDANGDHGSGRARAWGLSSSPRRPGRIPWVTDLEITSDGIDVDETLRRGLDGHRNTRTIWDEYQPDGGRLGLHWRLLETPETRGLTAAGEVWFEGARLAWHELPIPFEETSGNLRFLWGAEPAWRSEDKKRGIRPFGMRYVVSNREADAALVAPAALGSGAAGPRGARAAVQGFLRDEFLELSGPKALPQTATQELAIELDEMLLRGRDFDAVARRFPDVAEAVAEWNAKGSVAVDYRGGRASPSAPYESNVEVTPVRVELTPSVFQRRTREIRGRVLTHTLETTPSTEAVRTRIDLRGRWPGDVDLACAGVIVPGLPGTVMVYGAGADPMNTSFRGALFTALAEGEPHSDPIDMSGRALEGRIDFRVRSELVPASELEPTNLYHVFLRDNVLENDSLRLEDLHGVLEQRGSLLSSSRIEAALAGHEVELRDVNVFQLQDAAGLTLADPLLLRPTFWQDPGGYALQADLYVRDLPLDDEHLSSLLTEESLETLRDAPDWRGMLDVDGARLVVTSESGDRGKVAVRGTVQPHDIALRFGVPIEVPRARVELEELIFEAGRVRGWGRTRDLEADVFGRWLRDARLLFSYVDGRMSIDNLSGEFCGGRLESLGGDGQGTRKALAFDLAAPYHFDLALRLEDVEVPTLLAGVFQSSVADAGRIDGGLRLSGTPRDVLGITGGGWLNLDDGRLWSIPVMRELFSQLGADTTGVFDRLRTHFEIQNGRLETSSAKIRSNLLSLVGSGHIDFDGTLAYDLEVRYSLLDRLGVLNRLLYWLNNSLWRVAVRGDMARPRVTIRNSILEFLKRFDDSPPRELPLPDYQPLPARF